MLAEQAVLTPEAVKRDVERFYDNTAPSYDRLYGEEQKAKYTTVLNMVEPVEGPILDAGCGTGLLFTELKDAEIVGVDISMGMLREAARKTRGKKHIHLVRCDIEELPLRSETFTACLSFTVAQNLPRAWKAFSELLRVAEPGGTIAVTFRENGVKSEDLKVLKLSGLKRSKLGKEEIVLGFKPLRRLNL